MSRYVVKTEDGKHLVYGYDRPLQEYFMQVWENEDDDDPAEDFDKKADIAEYLCKNSYTLPRDHIMAMVMDVPF